ncbi:MAG: hypothetical protein MUC81_01370 [Bacteroidia bacterium]|nr:hypothetical protein [Bacteroidia bacterium]
MKIIREHIVFRLFWLIMSLHIFNCSVDNPDHKPDSVPEDLTYNDLESVVEVVLEQVLEINNAIAEYDESDADDSNNGLSIKKGIDFSYMDNTLKFPINQLVFIAYKQSYYRDNFLTQYHPELTPPPPKG